MPTTTRTSGLIARAPVRADSGSFVHARLLAWQQRSHEHTAAATKPAPPNTEVAVTQKRRAGIGWQGIRHWSLNRQSRGRSVRHGCSKRRWLISPAKCKPHSTAFKLPATWSSDVARMSVRFRTQDVVRHFLRVVASPIGRESEGGTGVPPPPNHRRAAPTGDRSRLRVEVSGIKSHRLCGGARAVKLSHGQASAKRGASACEQTSRRGRCGISLQRYLGPERGRVRQRTDKFVRGGHIRLQVVARWPDVSPTRCAALLDGPDDTSVRHEASSRTSL